MLVRPRAGFYRSAYPAPDGSGETRHMAVTQFEPTDARRCFPCWDEPAIKATFQMALTVPTDRVVRAHPLNLFLDPKNN